MLMIGAGYLYMIWEFGWMGLAAVVVHIGMMLAATA